MNLIDPKDVKKTDPFVFGTVPDAEDLAYRLVDKVKELSALGVTANQFGLPYRVFVMVGEPSFVCFNPRIIDVSEEVVLLEEMDVMYKNLLCKIKRPRIIKVRFATPNGEVTTKKFDGMTSRVFQHNLDWLEGINYLRRANTFHRDQAMRKAKKLNDLFKG